MDDVRVVGILGARVRGREEEAADATGGEGAVASEGEWTTDRIGLFADVDRHVHGRRFTGVHPLSFVRLFGHPRRERRYRSNAAAVPS